MNAKFIEETHKKILSLIISQRKQISNKFGFNPLHCQQLKKT